MLVPVITHSREFYGIFSPRHYSVCMDVPDTHGGRGQQGFTLLSLPSSSPPCLHPYPALHTACTGASAPRPVGENPSSDHRL